MDIDKLKAAIRLADEASRCCEGVGLLYWMDYSGYDEAAKLIGEVLDEKPDMAQHR